MEYMENKENLNNSESVNENSYKAELENISVSLFKLFEKMETDYEEKIQELTEKCEALEQENVELKYKLKQLSEELKTLGERIVSEVIRRTSIPDSDFGDDENNNGGVL
ncbi:hypothetical protein [Desulfurobacterium atlanticum]|uniref:Cell division protein ZapB n=1 Tax=Desulfurobacterium atlanticum TaxID=240169 RepID=A0A238YWH2_9BACT|nr:hypothetical protein [Desulfurobacterium atlanticum]SNR74869.1 hypothetical protein SAMN06265340_10519 [Desulfurobacterium atlanticum]